MQKAKDVLAVLVTLAEVWAVMKTLRWLGNLEAWQAVLVLASIYLIWWAIDRYYHRICGKLDVLRQEITAEETNRSAGDQACARQAEIHAHQTVDAFNDIRAKIKALDDKIGDACVKHIALFEGMPVPRRGTDILVCVPASSRQPRNSWSNFWRGS